MARVFLCAPGCEQGVDLLPLYVEFAPRKPASFRSIFSDLSADGIDLLERYEGRVCHQLSSKIGVAVTPWGCILSALPQALDT